MFLICRPSCVIVKRPVSVLYALSKMGTNVPLIQPDGSKDWEAWKPIIHRLYWEENRELEEVRDIMGAEHNFIATYVKYVTSISERQ
jgi:hypothetical protein